MNIDIMDIVTLSNNNKYVVISKATYENKNYYYLANIDEENNMVKDLLVFYEDGKDFVEESSEEILTNLVPLLFENAKKVLPKEIFDKVEKLRKKDIE